MRGFSFGDSAGEILSSMEPKIQFDFRKGTDPAIGAKPGKTPAAPNQAVGADAAEELAREVLRTLAIKNPAELNDVPDAVLAAAIRTARRALAQRQAAFTDRSNDPAGDPSLNPTAAQRPGEIVGSGSIAQAAMPTNIAKAVNDALEREEIVRKGGVDSRLLFNLGKGRVSTPGASDALLKGDLITFETPIAKRDTASDRIIEIDGLIDRIAKRERQPLEFSAVFGGAAEGGLSSYTPLEQPDFASDLAKRISSRESGGAPLEKLLR